MNQHTNSAIVLSRQFCEKLSSETRGARQEFRLCIILITGIPLLSIAHMYYAKLRGVPSSFFHISLVSLGMLLMMALGYALLNKYPSTIVRLRRYLEDIVNGELPDKIRLIETEDDITAIETSMNLILDQLKQRVRVMQSEKTRLERELDQARQMEAIGSLAAGVAHEISTPIQFISDNVRFLAESSRELLARLHADISVDRDPDDLDIEFLRTEIPESLRQTQEGIERITKLIRAMKDFADKGTESEKAETDLNRAVQSTVDITRNEWKYAAEMELHLDPDLPPIICFAGEVKQALLNIIINAAHTIRDVVVPNGPKGCITISTRCEDGDAVIEVADTGAGIPAEIQDRVFDPFFSTKEVGKGVGQGLATAYWSITKKHGGSLRFDTQEGKGTVFTLRLPAGAVPGPVAAEPDTLHTQSNDA